MSPKIKLPVRVDSRHSTILDADGNIVCIGTFGRGPAIARALNAQKSTAVKRAEKAVVRAAMKWGLRDGASLAEGAARRSDLLSAIARLQAARAAAKKGKAKP